MREECAERGLEVIENLCKRLVEEYGETFGEDSVHMPSVSLFIHRDRAHAVDTISEVLTLAALSPHSQSA